MAAITTMFLVIIIKLELNFRENKSLITETFFNGNPIRGFFLYREIQLIREGKNSITFFVHVAMRKNNINESDNNNDDDKVLIIKKNVNHQPSSSSTTTSTSSTNREREKKLK